MDTNRRDPGDGDPSSTTRSARNLAVVRAPAGAAADPGREGAARTPRRSRAGRARARARASSSCAPTASSSRTCSARSGMLQFMQTGRARVAVPTTIHCDHLIQARVGGELGPARVARREPRGLRLPALGRGEVRRGLLGAGRRDHPPGRARELRLPRRADPRHRLAHAERRRASARARSASAGADAVEVIAGLPWELLYPRRIAVYLTGELGGWTAPKDVILWVAGQLARRGRHERDRRVHRPGRAHDQRDRQGDDRQHGRRARRDDVDVPRRRAHGALPARDRPRRDRARSSRRAARAARARPRSRGAAPRSTTTACSRSTSRGSSRTSSGRTRRTARGRSRSSRPRSRDPANGFPSEISAALIGSCTNSSYEDMSRAADVARAGARAAACARRVAVLRDAGLGADPRDDRARRPAAGAARRSAASCSRTPAARASASGGGRRTPRPRRTRSSPRTTATSRRATTATRDAELHREPGDRDRVRARRPARRSTRCATR